MEFILCLLGSVLLMYLLWIIYVEVDEEPEDTLEPIVHSKGFNEALHILLNEEAFKIRENPSYSRREKVFRTDEYLRSKLRDKRYNEITDYEKLYLLCFDREF